MAALIVLLHHACDQWLTAYPVVLKRLESLSHAAVVIFFVLSGYLIAYTTTSNNRGPRKYAVARLSRLYSVLLPALLLTAVIELVVSRVSPELAAGYTRGHSLPRYVLSAIFCNESGLLSASPPINGPLWSLSFEFWYYAVFGLWFFRRSDWKSRLLLVGACCVAGPKILLLMPIWLLGFGAYRLQNQIASARKAWVLVFTFLAFAVLGALYLPDFPYALGAKPFFYANRFLADWLIGLVLALSLWCLPHASPAFKFPFVGQLRLIADLSFPLYILHYPLLVLWRALFGTAVNDVSQLLVAVASVSLVAVAIGFLLDKQRGRWIQFFAWVVGLVGARAAVPANQLTKK